MMKDEEPPKEVDKLYQYFDPKCEIAFQMFWKQTSDNFVSDDICIWVNLWKKDLCACVW